MSSEDFVFALREYKVVSKWVNSPGGDDRNASRFMNEIVPIDARTFKIRWNQPYAGASAVAFQPLPRHILEPLLEGGDQDKYLNSPHWSIAYVGAGPYRLTKWERNAFMDGAAFEGFALGRPKIDRIVLTFSDRPPVTVAHLLSGELDMAVDRSIEFQEIRALREEWVARTQAKLLLSPITLRYLQIQQRPQYADPEVLLDLRTRQALVHAIDRAGLAEAMVEDRSMAADTMLPRNISYYADIDRVATKYPFDPRRTEQLMSEMGYAKGPDGLFISATARRYSQELGGLSEGQEAQDTTIVADFLKRAGFDTSLNLIPAALRDGPQADEMSATFPALNTNNNSLTPPLLGMHKWVAANIGTAENRWRGTNKMGWATPGYERLFEAFNGTLNLREASRHMVQMVKIFNDELPAIPLYFNFSVMAHVGSLQGPEPATPSGTIYYNLHQWEWR